MIAELFSSIAGPVSPATVFWLALVLVVAGVSRGLTGFGAALIFIPLGSMLVGPAMALGLMWAVDTPTSLPISLRAARRAPWREPLLLLAGWALTTPIGLAALKRLDPLTVRWIICVMIFAALAMLVGGWRYRGRPTATLAIVTGMAAGLAGGLTGMSGPPILMMWLAAAAVTAANVRDGLNLFYLLNSVGNAILLTWFGILDWAVLKLGLALALPYGLGLWLGAIAFSRLGEGDFRRISYATIAVAAVLALPVLDGLFGR